MVCALCAGLVHLGTRAYGPRRARVLASVAARAAVVLMGVTLGAPSSAVVVIAVVLLGTGLLV